MYFFRVRAVKEGASAHEKERNALLTFQGIGLRMVIKIGVVCKPISKSAKGGIYR